MKIDKFWLFKIHSMAEEGGDSGGGSAGGEGNASGSMLPAAGEGAGNPGDGDNGDGAGSGDPGAGDDDQSWFKKDKYKTVEDQAKAYNDLEKKLGETAKLTGAPEDGYEAVMPDGVNAEFIEGHPALDAFKEVASKYNLSQDVFNEILGSYVSAEAQMQESSIDEEMKQLGDNADRRLQDLADFGSANLDQATYEAFRATASTAAGVKMLENMIALSKDHKMPQGDDGHRPNTSGVTPESLREMANKKDEHGHRLMSIDPDYKKKVDQAYEDYYGKAPKKTVVG